MSPVQIAKRGLIAIIILALVMISSAVFVGCPDMDEALPHYKAN